MALREVDLLRTLLIALVATTETDLNIKERKEEIKSHLAYEDWFTIEGYSETLPQMYLGCELLGYKVSSLHGTVTCTFSNGQEVECDMLIGFYNL
jgi:hypothetical protein